MTFRSYVQKLRDSLHDLRTSPNRYLVLSIIGLSTVLIFLTCLAAIALQGANREITSASIDRRIRDDKVVIARTMSAHSQALLSAIGLINTVDITPEVWDRFINSYQNDEAFPGISSIGATRHIPLWQVPALERELSKEYGRKVSVFPESNNRFVEPVLYSNRRDGLPTSAVGLDVLQLPERAEAAHVSTETNRVALSDVVSVIDNPQNGETEYRADTPSAFVLFAPYYAPGADISTADNRLAAVQGHAYISFRTQDLFALMFQDASFKSVALTVYQKENPSLVVFRSTDNPKQKGSVTQTSELQVFNKTYIMEYQFSMASILSPVQRFAPLLAFISGIIISVIVPALVYIIVRSRQNSIELANEQEIKKAQDQLLSLASHQLRTPATATKQYLGMVLQGFMGEISKQQSGFLQKAYDSNERQLRIINDILHVAKLDAGRIVPSKKTFDITSVVKGVLEDNQSEFESSNITVRKKLGKKVEVVADEYMIRMIIENLVSNAIKYTNAGGAVRVTASTDDTGYLLSVRDSGVGIAKKDLDRLFKQFSRIPNERSGKVSGSGVGLYLAQNLARLHGGEIMVESKEGKGSTFTLRLPRKM